MTRDISTGVEQVVKAMERNQSKSISDGWRKMRDKLDSILLHNNVMKTNETIMACKKIDELSHEQRIEYITSQWGPLYAERCMPILMQLQQLEKYAHQIKDQCCPGESGCI